MRISPHEILSCLGFDVPPEGIEIGPNEGRFYVEAFRALGETIDVSAIPEAALVNLYNESSRLVGEAIDVSTIPDSLFRDLNDGLKKLVLACNNEGAQASLHIDSDAADWLSMMLNLNVSVINKKQNSGLSTDQLYCLEDLIDTSS